MSADSESLPPPNNPDEFESLCLDLWREIWQDQGAQKNGRKGQPQAGIDVFGQEKEKWVGVQCKQKDGLLRSQVTVEDLQAEVEKAKQFRPSLSAFILATTGPADQKVQQCSRELTEQHRAKGLFSVSVRSWREIWQELYRRPELLQKLGPVYWSRLWASFSQGPNVSIATATAVANSLDLVGETVRDTGQAVIDAVTQEVHKIQRLLLLQKSLPDKVSEVDLREKIYLDRIDQVRKLLESGKPKSARRLLEDLRLELSGQQPTKSLLYRIATNLASCAMQLDEREIVTKEIDTAFQLDPENPEAISNAAANCLNKGQPDQALALAIKARTRRNDDPFATANYIQALFALDRDSELELLIVSEPWITQDGLCCSVIGTLLLNRGKFEESEKYLRLARNADPEDPRTLVNLAHSLMRPVQKALLGQPVLTWKFPPEFTSRLREACGSLTQSIEIQKDYEGRGFVTLAHVLRADARRMLGDPNGAILDCEIALSEDPDNADALQIKALSLLHLERVDEAIAYFEKIQDPERIAQVLFPLAMAYNVADRPDAAVRLLEPKWRTSAEPKERIEIADHLLVAYMALRQKEKADEIIQVLRTSWPNLPSAMATIARYESKTGKIVEACGLLTEALAYATGPERDFISLELADLHFRNRRFAEAAELYESVVDLSTLNDLSTRYILCLFNSGAHKDALRLAKSLRGAAEPTPILSQIEANVLAETGDLKAAQDILEALGRRYPETYYYRINAAELAMRRLQEVEARQLLESVKFEEIRNDARALARVAQLRARLGMSEVLRHAFQARRVGYGIPEIHAVYVALFVSREQVDTVDLTKDIVDEDCAVILDLGTGKISHTVCADADLHPEQGEISVAQARSMGLVGRRKLDRVVLRKDAFGANAECSVVEVQSKYVRAFQDTLEKFPTLFPTDTALQGVAGPYEAFRDGMFKQLDEQQRRQQRVEEFYRSQKITLEAFAQTLGSPLIDVWAGLISGSRLSIWASSGSPEESQSESDAIADADDLLLDMVGLLTLAQIDLLETVSEGFKLFTTQPAVDGIAEAYALVSASKPHLVIGKDGDNYCRQEITSENIEANKRFLARVLNFLRESVSTLAITSVLDSTLIKHDLRDFLGPISTASLLAAQEHKLVLLSDDLMLRTLARNEWRVRGAWSGTILDHLKRKGILSASAYTEAVGKLAALNYKFVRVNADSVMWVLDRAAYKTTNDSTRILSIFRGPECTPESAVEILAEVTKRVWLQSALYHLKVDLLDAILEALVTNRPTNQTVENFRNAIQAKLFLVPQAVTTIEQRIDLWKKQKLGRVGIIVPVL